MTLLDFEELVAYWNKHPPPHLLLAAYLGVGREQSSTSRTLICAPARKSCAIPDEFGSLAASLGPGFTTGDVHAGLASVVLDFAELKRRSDSAG